MDNSSSENQQKSMRSTNTKDKIVSLIKTLENDISACDFKWTLFVTAANSYKYDSLLKPFPNAYVIDKILNITHLREIIASIPNFGHLLSKLQSIVDKSTPEESDGITAESIDLLYWCLIRAKEPTLKSVHSSNVSEQIIYWQIEFNNGTGNTKMISHKCFRFSAIP